MGRSKHCSDEERKVILRLRGNGITIRAIAELVGRSKKMVQNALKKPLTLETRGRPKKTSEHFDRLLIRKSKENPFASSKDLKKILDAKISPRSIRRRLLNASLPSRSPRKVPLLSKKNIRDRLTFARTNLHRPNWKNVLWSDETKVNLFGSDGKQYVRRPANAAFDPRYTLKTVKFGGGNIMVWGCFSYYGVGPLHLIEGNMNKEMYKDILTNVMLPYAEENMPLVWQFQQDNDPKHTSKLVKTWFQDQKIPIMTWPAQSPDINPIENLWNDLKHGLPKTSNKDRLWQEVQKAWYSIPVSTCQKLVLSMTSRCKAVLKSKGHATKY